jgi:hypothetical protein
MIGSCTQPWIDKSKTILREEFRAAMVGFSGREEMKAVLESLLASMSRESASEEMNFKKFSALLEKLLRMRGERLSWARTLRLESGPPSPSASPPNSRPTSPA